MHFGNQRKKFIHLSTLSWHHNESPSRGHVPRVPACPRVSALIWRSMELHHFPALTSQSVVTRSMVESGAFVFQVTDYVHWRLCGENINRHPSLSTDTWISSKNYPYKTTKMVLNSRLEGTRIASDLTSAGWTEGEEEDSLVTALTTFSSTFCSWLELFTQSASLETWEGSVQVLHDAVDNFVKKNIISQHNSTGQTGGGRD